MTDAPRPTQAEIRRGTKFFGHWEATSPTGRRVTVRTARGGGYDLSVEDERGNFETSRCYSTLSEVRERVEREWAKRPKAVTLYHLRCFAGGIGTLCGARASDLDFHPSVVTKGDWERDGEYVNCTHGKMRCCPTCERRAVEGAPK